MTHAGSTNIRVLLPTGVGINCEAETAFAFQQAGAQVDSAHVNNLIQDPSCLLRAHILVFAGGFSFGDHLGAGTALANRLRSRLEKPIEQFLANGGLVLGICNGFQVIVRLGLLPTGTIAQQTLSLAPNRHGTFYDGWVRLQTDPNTPCVYTRGIEQIELPVRHGEGRLVATPELIAQLKSNNQIPLRYVDAAGDPTDEFPANPNASMDAAAGVCDPTGRVFGLMPHPEAFLYLENHPQWRRRAQNSGNTNDSGKQRARGDGLQFFKNAVKAAAESR